MNPESNKYDHYCTQLHPFSFTNVMGKKQRIWLIKHILPLRWSGCHWRREILQHYIWSYTQFLKKTNTSCTHVSPPTLIIRHVLFMYSTRSSVYSAYIHGTYTVHIYHFDTCVLYCDVLLCTYCTHVNFSLVIKFGEDENSDHKLS